MTHRQLFEEFMDQNLDQVYRFAFSYMGNPQDAEDVVSDSVVKALKALDGLREPEYLATWFHRIVINTAKSALLKRGRMIPYDPQDEQNIALFDEHLRSEDDNLINPTDNEAISDLPFSELISLVNPAGREIIVLRYLEDKSLQEISELLEINLNTVKTRLYRGLAQLKQQLQGNTAT